MYGDVARATRKSWRIAEALAARRCCGCKAAAAFGVTMRRGANRRRMA